MGHGLDLSIKTPFLLGLLSLASGESVLVLLPLHHLVGYLHAILLALLVPAPLVYLSFGETGSL